MSNEIERPRPTKLPSSLDAYRAMRRTADVRNLNDLFETQHLALYETSEQYRALLEAVWETDAVEGSLAADDIVACQMVREAADKAEDKVLAVKKLATLVKCLHIVQKRYQSDRKSRRLTVGGQRVEDDDKGDGSALDRA